MRAPARAAAVLAVAALAAAAGSCAPGEGAPRRHEIQIQAFVYSPDTVAAAPGDTLVFINHDAVPHTAAAAGRWDTGDIPAGATRTVVVPASPTGPFKCAYHPTMAGALAAP